MATPRWRRQPRSSGDITAIDHGNPSLVSMAANVGAQSGQAVTIDIPGVQMVLRHLHDVDETVCGSPAGDMRSRRSLTALKVGRDFK